MAKGDSAVSNHHWALQDSILLDGVQDYVFGTSETLPDKSTTVSFQKCHILISNLSSEEIDTKNLP